jgi:hypothetical protein
VKRLALLLAVAGCGRIAFDEREPDSGVDHCVGVRVATGKLYDNVCTGLDDSICEYDGRVPVPAAWGQ